MSNPKVAKSEKGGYYVFCEAQSQPWGATLKASQDGERPIRDWLRVRHAREEEASVMGLAGASCWAVIVPSNLPAVIEVGGFDSDELGKGRAYFYMAPDKVVSIKRQDALDKVLGKVAITEVAVSENEDDLPF